MVWNYLFSSEAESSFDSQLLERIKEKSNEQVQATLRDAENLRNAVDSSGASLLHYAAEHGNEGITQLLLDAGAKVNVQDARGQTPLILATKGEHEETIRVLLENDADVCLADKTGVSALQLAVHEALILPGIVEMFLAQVKTDCSSSEDVARRLSRINCPLHIAVRLRDVDVMGQMLSEGSPIDAADPKSNETALHVAVLNGDAQMVELLVDRGADVNALDGDKETPLALMSAFDDPEILRILVNGKTNLTSCTVDGFMQMHRVLTKGTSEAVEIVVESGVDLRTKDSNERTAIHYLASNVNEGVVDALKKWLNDEVKDVKSRSLLDHIVEFLLEFFLIDCMLSPFGKSGGSATISVDWNARDKDGRTILHNAMAAGNQSFVKYLMRRGHADPNVKTADGVTPFFEALESESSLEQRVECVKFVMEGGAYPDVEMKRYLKSRNTKSAINRDFPLLEAVLAHLALREAKGERISEKLLGIIDRQPKLKDYVTSCRGELDEMKKAALFQSRKHLKTVTLFDFLADDDNKILAYVASHSRLEKLVKKHKFDSHYSRHLRQRLSDASNAIPCMQTELGITISSVIWFLVFVSFAPELSLIREEFFGGWFMNGVKYVAVAVGLAQFVFLISVALWAAIGSIYRTPITSIFKTSCPK